MRNVSTSRIAAVAALIVGVAAAGVILLGGGNDYVVKARMVDAGQLVKGGLVLVAGRPVGKVTDIRLTQDNQAELVMTITDDNARPLHRGTVAQIRLVGLSGVTNRYVDLQPGPESGAEIEDGGVLQQAETRPVVDLDTVLDALDEKTRNKLKSIIQDGDKIFQGTAPDANRATQYLNPAVAQGRALFEELAYDTAAIGKLVTTGATVASVLANRREDVGSGITATAQTLRAIANERASLQDALTRAPSVLRQGRATLATTRTTLAEFRPTLRALRPAAKPLADLLRDLPPVSRQARPVLDDLVELLPAVQKVLDGAPALAKVALPAVTSATSSVRSAASIFTGIRPYAPDLVTGLFNGLGGYSTTNYDANGHFARIGFSGGGPALAGVLNAGGAVNSPGVRTGVTARCPGAAADPAPDGSNPYIPDPSICDPSENRP